MEENEQKNWDGTIKLYLEGANDLKIGDIKSSDPYCKIEIKNGQHTIANFKTKVIHSNLNPLWRDNFFLPVKETHGNPLKIFFYVWDSDRFCDDDFLGECVVTVTPSEILGKTQVLPLQQRRPKESVKGTLKFAISYLPQFSQSHNKYRHHNHKITGLARSLNSGESTRTYGTYDVALHHVPEIFGDAWQHWNTKYEAAKTIFGSSVVCGTISAQHKHLYSDGSVLKEDILKNGDDLLALVGNGIIGGKPRFFTYALMDNTWFFSETGAAFFTDFTSKHAMHACVSEVVRYAGEFHFQPNENGKYRLVIDNNSGTYAPNKELLPMLKNVFEVNFPGLEVEVLDFGDPKLKEYKEIVQKTKKIKK